MSNIIDERASPPDATSLKHTARSKSAEIAVTRELRKSKEIIPPSRWVLRRSTEIQGSAEFHEVCEEVRQKYSYTRRGVNNAAGGEAT